MSEGALRFLARMDTHNLAMSSMLYKKPNFRLGWTGWPWQYLRTSCTATVKRPSSCLAPSNLSLVCRILDNHRLPVLLLYCFHTFPALFVLQQPRIRPLYHLKKPYTKFIQKFELLEKNIRGTLIHTYIYIYITIKLVHLTM